MPTNPDNDRNYTAKKAGRKGLMLAIMRATNEDERWACIQALDEKAFEDGVKTSAILFEVVERPCELDIADE